MQGTQTSLAVVKTLTGEKTLTLHSKYHLPSLYKNAGGREPMPEINELSMVDDSEE
jgi:hypothetical protein